MNERPIRAALAAVAELLRYPREGFEARAQMVRERLAALDEPLAAACGRFLAEVRALGPARHQELYTRTFDLAPSCVPFLSVHLFGDGSFARAKLMTGLVEAYARTGHEHGSELPDHVAVVLAWAPRAPEEEWDELRRYVLPAPLAAMAAVLENAGNPYRHLLTAVAAALGAARKEAAHA